MKVETELYLVLVSAIHLVIEMANAASFIAGPDSFIIMSGPLPVQYILDEGLLGAYLGLYRQGDTTQIARAPIQQGVYAGIVQFGCGTVTTPGSYEVRLFNSDGVSLTLSSVFEASWPALNLTIPQRHIAQEDVHPQLTTRPLNRINCKRQDIAINFTLEVEFSEDMAFSDAVTVYQERGIALRDLISMAQQFRCELFDSSGFYRVLLKQSLTGVVVSVSNVMTVTWGDYYQLTSPQASVFPCVDVLIINYTRPQCVTREDNIHMFAVRSSSTHHQHDMEYMYEAKATVTDSSTSFSCDDIRQYQWRNQPLSYCFRYQTVASNQAVTDLTLFCLPTNTSIGLPVHGQWSTWAHWSQCTGNCEWGKQSRYRYCTNPKPANSGKYCEGGEPVEWRDCQSSCKPAIETGSATDTVTSRPADRVPDCWCGCTMLKSTGLLIPGRQCPGTSEYRVHIIWLIQGGEGMVIQLNITEFRWDLASHMLKIRDGAGYNGELLLDLKGNLDTKPQRIVSSGNYLHVEFISTTEPLPVQPDLFIGNYIIAVPEEDDGPVITNLIQEEEKAPWRLPVIVAGGVGGFVIVVTLIGVCAFKRINSTQSPKANRTKQSISNKTSPNHVVIQVQDGEYTNFGDVTIAPSVQTTKTTSSKKKRNQKHHSPSKAVLAPPLPDPYHVKPEDFIHDTDLLHLAKNAKHAHVSSGKHQKKKLKKKRRQKHRHEAYNDPREVDRLINSLPGGSSRMVTSIPIDPDSEYRALINHLSSTGSHNQSELVNTSAEVHLAPNTTPVENTSQELSPMVSPTGQRSPCMDDGYNSLANTGSTQSNLSSRGREHIELPRLNRIREKQSSRSENSSELSPKRPQSCSIDSPRQEQRRSIQSCHVVSPHNDLHSSHVTCPLLRPDGQSEDETQSFDESLPNPIQSSLESSPRLLSTPQQNTMPGNPPPPTVFADKPLEGPRVYYIKKNNDMMTPSQSTNSDSYEYDDYLPPPVGHDSFNSDLPWPQPPVIDEAQAVSQTF